MNSEQNVLVVGAGPVGLMMAGQLQKNGVSCRLVEKRMQCSPHSKALSINAASLKILEQVGVVDQFLQAGKQVSDIYAYWKNHRMMRVNYKRLSSPYRYFLSLPQPQSEEILAAHLEQLGGRIERGVSLDDICPSADGVQVTLIDQHNLATTEHFDYVVACDGGKSMVRQCLNMPFVGHDYGMCFRLIDVHIEWDGPIDQTHYFVQEDGFIIVIPMAGGFHRIVLLTESGKQGDDTESLTMVDYQRLVRYYSSENIHLQGSLLWESSAPFYNRLVDSYSCQDRVFFAGDSAHLFSPIGGQGMNTGLQDANNLAWKLSGVINHGWHADLLKTYATERRQIGQSLVESTNSSTRVITGLDEKDQQKNATWLPSFNNRHNMRYQLPMRFSGLMQQYSPSDFVTTIRHQYALVGAHVPYVVLDDQLLNSTYDFINQVPSLLLFGQATDELLDLINRLGFGIYQVLADLLKQLPKSVSMITDQNGTLASAFNARLGDLFLLRPDGFIGFSGHINQMSQIQRYLENWYGH